MHIINLFKLSILLSLFLGLLLNTISDTHNIYYVAKDGSDSNPGTLDQPWLTMQKASQEMVAGDTAYVRGGTYYERVKLWASGTASNPITYKAYPGESPIIDGKGLTTTAVTGLIDTNYKSYVIIDGFHIQNALDTYLRVGIYDNGVNLTFKNLIIHDTNASAIESYGSNITIDGCEIYNTNISGGNEGISLMGVDTFEVKYCIIHDTNGKEGMDFKNGCSNGLVHNNEVYRTKNGIKVDTYDNGTDNILIYTNYIYDCDYGIAIISEQGQNVSNVSVFNNIVLNCDSTGLHFAWKFITNTIMTTYTNINIYNNTIYSKQGVSIGTYNCSTEQFVNCKIINNIIDSNSYATSHYSISSNYMYPISELTVDYNLLYTNNYESGTYFGNNYIMANPLFVNPGTDFSLQSSSPAINNGSPSLAPAADYAGNARPQGTGYDIGAYEYVNLK